jgi:hypothetical protein
MRPFDQSISLGFISGVLLLAHTKAGPENATNMLKSGLRNEMFYTEFPKRAIVSHSVKDTTD